MAACTWNVPASTPCTSCSASSPSSPVHAPRARLPPVRRFSSALDYAAKARRIARDGASRSERPWNNGWERFRYGRDERRVVRRSMAVRAMADNEIQPSTETEIQPSGEKEIRPSSRGLRFDNEVVEQKGLTYDGPGKGGQWLSSTTRHVRIYIGVVDPETQAMDQQQLDKVTLMLDPDNEFIWPEEQVRKVYDYFTELVDGYEGAPCNEYTLRLIGSDIEHYIRKLLLGNEIKYNLDCRVLNFSMGKPRYESGIIEEGEV